MFEYKLVREKTSNERFYKSAIESSFVKFDFSSELINKSSIKYTIKGEYYDMIKTQAIFNMLKHLHRMDFNSESRKQNGATHFDESDEVSISINFKYKMTYQDFYLISEYIAIFAVESIRVAFCLKKDAFSNIIKCTNDDEYIVEYGQDFMPSLVCMGYEDSAFHMIGGDTLFPAYLIPKDNNFNKNCLQATGFYVRCHNQRSKTGMGTLYTFRDLGEIDAFWNLDLLSNIKRELRNYYHPKAEKEYFTSNTFLRQLEIMMALKLSNYQKHVDSEFLTDSFFPEREESS